MDYNFDNLTRVALSFLPEHPGADKKYHFAFLMIKNRIQSFGYNMPKTHTFAALHNYPFPSIHAEAMSIMRRPRGIELRDCYMVNMRLSRLSLRNGEPVFRMSKPCVSCEKMLSVMGLRRVIYTTDDGFAEL